ncbi:GntR family transcriptional regulator [Alcanivorax sp. HI0083]|jgi:putative oxidoreductase|uniref:DoxX family protein n=1 Tax=unclassified Alcanivorax TaxID=2638842 RepID=UPI0007B7D62E|nr:MULTISPECIES: DoxX family protein [unclassified Alcanivorax]KZY30250.1 GntR family transcriptional regulator [Alcanivorax sp. HI0044]KZZ22062.1 GntR family transcriptional regulator [Alcanivorax sp. HI0083]MTT52701.1 DoxX family membrane protein [Alcanivorax sp. VBW004]PHR67451.1 MAG: DoxX family protein [Alcanivorax sp.]HIL23443.1 DoxX family protein [Alcanivorax sp.]
MLNNPDIGKLILRLSLGLMLLLHGVHKLHAGVGWIAGVLAEHHLPGFLAYGVFIGEVIAPVMVIIGYQTRIGAALIVGNMLVALVLAHMGELFSLSNTGGWAIELQAFYLFTAAALVFLGAGKYAMKN